MLIKKKVYEEFVYKEEQMSKFLKIAGVLFLLVCMSSAFVFAGGEQEKAAAGGELAGVKIGFVNAGPDDYYAQFGDTFKAIANTYGMEVTELNSDYKPEKELANVQDLISKGVEAIAVITAGAAGSAATVEAANKAGVPIFFIAGKPELRPGTELTGHVTDNFVIMGYQVGKWVVDNVKNPKVVNIPGFLGQGTAEGEIVGFNLAFDEAGLPEPFLTKSSEWQRTLAIPIVQDLVASGRDFNVLFACNEETAAGALTVFDELNVKGVTMVSCNGKEEGWAWLESGEMAATSPNPPSLNADLCVQQIVRHLKGEPFEKYLQIMPWDVLTKDNLDQAIPWITKDYLKGRAANQFQWSLDYYEKQYKENKALFEDFDKKLNEYMANR
jgi:ribose transport system substrate-binding protein